MSAAHAYQPPQHAPAQALQEAITQHTGAEPRRLPTSLSAIPAVQRKCATCEAEDENQTTPVQPRLNVGPVNDTYEREADAIAGQVMAMREPGAASAGGETAHSSPAVQRACNSCSTSSDEVQRKENPLADIKKDEEDKTRMRTDGANGGETIAASSTQLTAGGAPLPNTTRNFFETRMGRDLSDVRIHQGGDSDGLNHSISSRAFTYQNHIWLGNRERATPSFTMAHELAHVLQQTQPGSVSEQDRNTVNARRNTTSKAADAIIQRKANPFWLPAQYTLPGASSPRSPLSENSAKHDAAAKALAKANSSGTDKVLTEVMIPNATAGGTACGVCGFADLYKSDNNKAPGVELDCNKPANVTTPTTDPKTVAGLRNFNPSSSSSCTKHLSGRKQVFSHSRAPTMVNGSIAGALPGITGIQIADMKPGHNETARAKGVSQIENYFKGLSLVRSAAKKSGLGNIWTYGNPKLMPKTKMPKIPPKWDPNSKSGTWPVNNLRLHMGAGDDYSPGGVKGRWCIAPDNVNKGIWTYFLAPDPVTLAAALKTPASPPANFKKSHAKIKKIIGCLKATPSQKKAACKRPLPNAKAKRPENVHSKFIVQRKKLPEKDHFDLKNWNALRTGKPTGTESLKAQLGEDVPKKIRDKIRFQGRAIESIEWMKSSLGVSRSKPAGAKSLLENKTVLEKAMFWSGDTGVGDIAAIFGMLRKRLGGVYVKVAKLYKSAKEKIRKAFKGTKFKTGSGSSIGKTAVKILGKIFFQLGKVVLKKTTVVITNCIETGFSKFIDDKISGSVEQLTEQVDKIKTYIDKLTDDIVNKIKSKFDAFISSYEKTLKDLASSAKMIAKVVGTISEIVKIARLAFCASGLTAAGWGAIVTCLLSIADWVASKFDKSPLDWVIKQFMNSCRGRRMFAQALLYFDEIRTLPAQLAKGILGPIKEALPTEVKGIVCDLDNLTVDKLSMADYKCIEGDGDGGGDGDGEGGTPGGTAQAPTGQSGGTKPQGGVAQAPGTTNTPRSAGANGNNGNTSNGGGNKKPPTAISSSHDRAVNGNDPSAGQAVIESGVNATAQYNKTTVTNVIITMNAAGHVFRNVSVKKLVIVKHGADNGSKKTVICYFPTSNPITFRNEYPDGSWYEWGPDRGSSNLFNMQLR